MAANPIREPFVKHGPLVMSTEADVRRTLANYADGTFRPTSDLAGSFLAFEIPAPRGTKLRTDNGIWPRNGHARPHRRLTMSDLES